jgi:hypothetical protein
MNTLADAEFTRFQRFIHGAARLAGRVHRVRVAQHSARHR